MEQHSIGDPKYVIIDGKICNSFTKQPIPDNEPIFIMRGKDRKALRAIRNYASTCDSDDHQKAVGLRVKEFEKFQKSNEVQEPDTDGLEGW